MTTLWRFIPTFSPAYIHGKNNAASAIRDGRCTLKKTLSNEPTKPERAYKHNHQGRLSGFSLSDSPAGIKKGFSMKDNIDILVDYINSHEKPRAFATLLFSILPDRKEANDIETE